MKHQYESEILFHLMERDGFNIPSSVPPYESEIKAYLINQVKLAYPKLTDYEAEWLLYNYTKHLPADFPIRSATNVTEATFENVVPFAYQSAILKGHTLVNLLDKCFYIGTPPSIFSRIAASKVKVTTGKKYLLKYSTNQPLIVKYHENNVEIQRITNGNDNIIISSKYDDIITVITSASDVEYNVKINLLEYIDNMENWDIPYFEGIQSVKTPVLTTTGKNFFDGELQQGFWSTSSGLHVNHQGSVCSVNPIKVQEDTYLTISQYGEVTYNGTMMFLCYDANSNLIGHIYNRSQVYKNTSYVHFRIYDESGTMQVVNPNIKIQVESSSTPTSYEPYKTNILTVNEDVTLRSNGSVCDELDLLTGKLTQRIDEDGEILTQEVVKTVDLKTVNESGESVYFMPLEGTMNVQSSGETIQPTFDMSVPVEATTQNLSSFIDLEMEE